MVECPVCGLQLEQNNLIKNELFSCPDCGAELEVIEINPLEVKEAPKEEEDWGE